MGLSFPSETSCCFIHRAIRLGVGNSSLLLMEGLYKEPSLNSSRCKSRSPRILWHCSCFYQWTQRFHYTGGWDNHLVIWEPRVSRMAGVMDPNNLGEIWVAGAHWEQGKLFLALPCLIVKAHRNMKQPKKSQGNWELRPWIRNGSLGLFTRLRPGLSDLLAEGREIWNE